MLTGLAMIDLVENDFIASSVGEDFDDYLGQAGSDIIQRELAQKSISEKFPFLWVGDKQAFFCDGDDRHLLNYMPQLERLFTNILVSDEPPVVKASIGRARQAGFRLTMLGKDIFRVCQYFAHREGEGRDWTHAYAHHEFHPGVAVLFGAVTQWWMTICRWEAPTRALIEGGPDMVAVEGMCDFVRFVRRACRSRAFKNLLHDHERKADDNFRSSCNYITKLFKQHSRLLVLRIDLYFRSEAKDWGYSKEAAKEVTNYLRALRLGRIVPDYLGFIIKRENGISRGVHYHLMVFLDGHLHRNAYHLTRVMGEAWMTRVGVDKGSYFNCYAKKDRYRYNGLGLVHVSDVEKLIGIRIALWYMSKQDSVLKVDGAKVKNFWRAWKVKSASPRGAPRKNGDSMHVVRRFLGGKRSRYPPGFEPPKNKCPNERDPRSLLTSQVHENRSPM